MKLYANNGLLAEYQLDIAFASLRNEGRQPVDVMALAYDLLVGGIDTTATQQVVLHGYLRQVLADHDSQSSSSPTGAVLNIPDDSQGETA